MVNKCSAFGYKRGYKGHEQAGVKMKFHSVPLNNKDLCDKWIRANPRQGPKTASHHTLQYERIHAKTSSHRYILNCARYISSRPTSLISLWTLIQRDVNTNQLLMEKNCLWYLKEYVVSSIFQNAPKYLSTNFSEPRETVSATASSRFKWEVNHLSVRGHGAVIFCSRWHLWIICGRTFG